MVKNTLWVLGIVFILIGIWGFFTDMILGIFMVDMMHNLVHLLSGILALVFAGHATRGVMFARILGIIYALVAIIGFFSDSILGLFMVNMADTWLHLVLAIVLLYVGFAGGKKMGMMNDSMPSNQPMA